MVKVAEKFLGGHFTLKKAHYFNLTFSSLQQRGKNEKMKMRGKIIPNFFDVTCCQVEFGNEKMKL